DVVLNPLGVPSRMNVGQILETHLGLACRGLGRLINEALEQYRESGAIDRLKETVGKVYGTSNGVSHLDEEQLVVLGNQIRNGVPVATPVFDGARESDINEMLKLAGFDTTGQATLYDGRTG